MSRLSEARARAAGRWATARRTHFWLDHVVLAWQRFQFNKGSQFAAAITYFSFLALFPLLLLAIAVTGFVLNSHEHLRTELFQKITENVPGSFGTTLSHSVQTLINARTGVGIIGLAGVLLTGLGWIGNLRQAIDAVWGIRPPKRNFVISKLANLGVLAGLGLGAIVSIGLTVVGTQLAGRLVRAVGLQHVTGIPVLVAVLGVVLAVAGDMFIFSWVLVALPKADIARSIAVRGSLLASVGFEILKFAGTYTIAASTKSATAGPFAGVIAVLVWVQLVARWLLFCAAWIATAKPGTAVAVGAAVGADGAIAAAGGPAATPEPARGPSPFGVAAGLLGAGAAVGAGAVAWIGARRPSKPVHPASKPS